MKLQHILVIATCLSGFGGLLTSLPDWNAASTPLFIGSSLAMIGSTVLGIYTPKP